MINRIEYLNRLIRFKDKKLIKVVTGVRRCGKSTLFDLFQSYLIERGIKQTQIISLNLEAGEYAELETSKQLYNFVSSQIKEESMYYIFLDEVQQVSDFQKAVDALFIKDNCDVYITGSNAYLLSGELATLLSGRYIEVKMMPLSFQEYTDAQKEAISLERMYQNYIHNSSFPYTLELDNSKDIRLYLEAIYDSILLKDIITRRSITDVEMLKSIVRFMFDNIGNLCSIKKITDTMKSAGRNIGVHTIEKYLDALTESFIFYRVNRYDIKGKEYLRTGYKYYAVDIGLRFMALGNKPFDRGHILENIVFLELLRRNYEIYIGKVDNKEVDFIAIGEHGEEYYQVAYTVIDAEGNILERELAPLLAIKDHNPKYLLTMDNEPMINHQGIKQIYALEWLNKL